VTDPLACAACGRIVSGEVRGIAGSLGYCPCSDREGAPLKLRPAAPLSEVTAYRERLAYQSALRRGRLKRQTKESRDKLTARELEALRSVGEDGD
jgi:hypothetical protein